MVNDPRFRRRVSPRAGARGLKETPVRLEDRAESVDGEELIRLFVAASQERGLEVAESSIAELQQLLDDSLEPLFSGQFQSSIDAERAEMIYNAARASAGSEEDQARELLVQAVDTTLMEIVESDPLAMRELPGHKFEDLFADVLADIGFDDLTLRVMTDLGEADILGFSRDRLGQKIGYVFELKQLGESLRKVELREIARLHGLRESLREKLGVTQGIFVATTSFTGPAKQAGALHGLHLKDYEKLVSWIRSCYGLPGTKVG